MSVSSPIRETRVPLGAGDIARATVRLAHQIIERNPDLSNLLLVGVRTRGVPLAERLHHAIREIGDADISVQSIDVTPYRDDIAPEVREATHAPEFEVDGLSVIIVDDVLYTARTARAAMDALMDLGRPSRIQLAVLVDRGHRELPIRADYVGKNLPTSLNEQVRVHLRETDGVDEVLVVGNKAKEGRA